MLSYDGNIWSVPVNIHRANVLWYVPDNLKRWGIDVPKTWDDFFKVCGKLKGLNVTLLVLGLTWTATHLFETVLLAQLGPDDYKNLFAGRLKWTDDRVKATWSIFARILDCANSNGNDVGDWVPAGQMVIDGKAAFQVMGDWWAAYFGSVNHLTPGRDFGWASVPWHGGYV